MKSNSRLLSWLESITLPSQTGDKGATGTVSAKRKKKKSPLIHFKGEEKSSLDSVKKTETNIQKQFSLIVISDIRKLIW
jgi:cob(I)alamin adenosyltransferase